MKHEPLRHGLTPTDLAEYVALTRATDILGWPLAFRTPEDVARIAELRALAESRCWQRVRERMIGRAA